jgi:hypothetical protein
MVKNFLAGLFPEPPGNEIITEPEGGLFPAHVSFQFPDPVGNPPDTEEGLYTVGKVAR